MVFVERFLEPDFGLVKTTYKLHFLDIEDSIYIQRPEIFHLDSEARRELVIIFRVKALRS